jgi:hypothetical protein
MWALMPLGLLLLLKLLLWCEATIPAPSWPPRLATLPRLCGLL